MKKLVLSFLSILFIASPALADNIMIDDPWSRETPSMARAGAAFMTVKNMGEADKIIGAKADVSDVVELHTHLNEDGIMKMRQVNEIEVPAGGMAELKPGGLHVMLIGLKAPLEYGKSFPLTLIFEKAGEMMVEVPIKSIKHMGEHKHHDGHHKDKDHDHKMHDHMHKHN